MVFDRFRDSWGMLGCKGQVQPRLNKKPKKNLSDAASPPDESVQLSIPSGGEPKLVITRTVVPQTETSKNPSKIIIILL
jgi:hypothetical protein